MTNQSINIYSQIFNSSYSKDDEFYQSVFTTPLHSNALLSAIVANCEGITSSVNHASQNVVIMRKLFVHGVRLLGDAMQNSDGEDESRSLNSDDLHITSNTTSRRSSIRPELDDGGDDITSLNGRISDNSGHILTTFDDGDDITSLNGSRGSTVGHSLPRRSSNASTQSNSAPEFIPRPSLGSHHSSFAKPARQFEGIDQDLRIQLITNILGVFQVWFTSLYAANTSLIHRKKGARSVTPVDIVSRIFELPGSSKHFNDVKLASLLEILKSYLDKTINEIVESSATEFPQLVATKDIIFLLSDILKSLYLSISLLKDSSNEYIILKSLLFAFYKIDFSHSLDTLLKISRGSIVQTEGGPTIIPPKFTLSPETYIKIITILSSFLAIPPRLLPLHSTALSSDITNLANEPANIYETALVKDRTFDSATFHQEFSSRIIPILAIDFNYYYNFRDDILISEIQNSSFLNWFTGNRFSDNLYTVYNTVENITNFQNNYEVLSLTKDKSDPFLEQLQHIYDKRMKIVTQQNIDDFLDLPELLSITLAFEVYVKNQSWLENFTEQKHKIVNKIEDIDHPNDKHIELFEIWLCLLSYVFQYQYKSESSQLTTKLSLSILLKLTSSQSLIKTDESKPISVLSKVKNYGINEFKWKLSHQKSPIIPIGLGRLGIKSSLFYILDCIQNLLRFNMTNRLNLDNFKMALNIIYQILKELKNDASLELDKYSWAEFHVTLFNLIRFIKRQELIKSKYYHSIKQVEVLKSMVEELFIILNFLLQPRFNDLIQFQDGIGGSTGEVFRSINYDLIYNILLNYETINRLLEEYELDKYEFHSLASCLEHFEQIFHLTEESKAQPDSAKLDMLEVDFDSPELISKINEYTFGPKTQESTEAVREVDEKEAVSGYKFGDTLRYVDKGIEADHIKEHDMIRVFNVMFRKQIEV